MTNIKEASGAFVYSIEITFIENEQGKPSYLPPFEHIIINLAEG